MKALIVFNHPAPYKVKLFNLLAKDFDLTVIFERESAKDRPANFYTEKEYQFNAIVLKKGYFGKENSISFELRNYIRDHHKEFDVIVMNGYSTISEQIAINFMIKNKIPYVLFINGGIVKDHENAIKKKLKRRYISNASGYLSPSKQASLYLTFYGAKKTIVHYPYCTYFESDIKPGSMSEEDRNAIRERYQLPYGKLFVSASNFIPRKNNFDLFDVMKGKKYSLVLYGDGPLKQKYFDYLKKNNIDNVIIRDFVPSNELIEIMSCCDCFITLSKEDIYGHTTLEAMAAGIPVISSNKVVSSLSVIKDFMNGYVCQTRNEVDGAMDLVDYTFMSPKCIETAKKYTIEKEAVAVATGLVRFIKCE